MPDALLTLTTDFGTGSPYVAAMKGVMLGIHPAVHILDLSHEVPPQDCRWAGYFLANVIPYFPPTALHVVVVDPGVGTARAILYVEVAGHRLLVPDNGCWSELARATSANPVVRRVTESRLWRPTVSATFHGRDIFAPVAAHLSIGLSPAELGSTVSKWVVLTPLPLGAIEFIDRFGNLLTNIPATALPAQPFRVAVGEVEITRRVRSYAEAEPGELVVLVSSNERLEIAVNQGNAAARLGVRVGDVVRLK